MEYPLAQTFYISKAVYPNGMYITAFDIFVERKPNTSLPIIVEIRKVVNGYPSSILVLPFARVTIPHSDVIIPPNIENIYTIRNYPTHGVFPSPVYLPPDEEYAFVVRTQSSDYSIFISEMGQKQLGTDIVIRQQPLLGSLFKSQNGRTWTPYQNEDLMFRLYKAVFDTSVTAELILENENLSEQFDYGLLRSNINYFAFPSTPVKFEITTKDYDTLQVVGPEEISVNNNIEFPTRRVVKDGGDVKMKITFSTNDKHVTPLVDDARVSVLGVKNRVNYYGLKKEGFTILDPGSGYTTAAITVSGGGGSGAVIEPVIENGKIVNVNVLNEGRGYESEPTITVSGDGAGASIVYKGFETDPVGGNAYARYIHRPIVLDSDFEAKSVTVRLDANRPVGTWVDVYVKVRASTDERDLSEIPWRKLVQKTNDSRFTRDDDEFIELEFVPDNDSLAYTYDGTTFDSVNTIVTKVVLLSENPAVVPRIRDFRVMTTI